MTWGYSKMHASILGRKVAQKWAIFLLRHRYLFILQK